MAKIDLRKSQLDLIDKVLLERDQLKAENERLREALQEINDWVFSTDYADTHIRKIVQQVLNEVNDGK